MRGVLDSDLGGATGRLSSWVAAGVIVAGAVGCTTQYPTDQAPRRPVAVNAGPSRPPTRVRVVAGDQQRGPILVPLPAPIVVEVGDDQGPISGATVTFELLVAVDDENVSDTVVVTGADGRVATTWQPGHLAGSRQLGVSVQDGPSALVTAFIDPGPASRAFAATESARFLLGTANYFAIVAGLEDAYGNRIGGMPARFAIDSGGGTFLETGGDTTSRTAVNYAYWSPGPLIRRNVAHFEAGAFRSEPVVLVGAVGIIAPVSGDSQRARPGAQVPERPTVQAKNLAGTPLGAGFPIQFNVIGELGGILPLETVVTDPTGRAALSVPWVLRPGAGDNRLLVTGELEEATYTFHAEAVPPKPERIVVLTGNGSVGTVGNFLAARQEVVVLDSAGQPLADQPILSEVLDGGGITRSFPAHRTDSLGRAKIANWRLGPRLGPQRLRISTPGLPPQPIILSAVAVSAVSSEFAIETKFQGVFPVWVTPILAKAVEPWERIVVGDLPDVAVDLPADAGGCFPAIHGTIDDVLIFVRVVTLDGPGKDIADARVCRFRSNGLPLISQITLDHDDLVAVDQSAGLAAVIGHMIGHSLGFGTAWNARSNLVDTLRFRFLGPSAAQAGNWLRWSPGSELVPLDWVPLGNGFDLASLIHWSPSLNPDIMSATVSRLSGISIATAGALRDLGYQVDDRSAVTFFAPGLGSSPIGTPTWRPDGWRSAPAERRPQ